jgi:hypothetical protein
MFCPLRGLARRELPKCRDPEMPNCELPKCRDPEMPELPKCRNAELAKCRIRELENFDIHVQRQVAAPPKNELPVVSPENIAVLAARVIT